ncbi:MAG: hypothetical protein AB1916_13800 [Thermodesulfobacteriota bacterium]
MSTLFKVSEPLLVPSVKAQDGPQKMIKKEHVNAFWESDAADGFSKKQGCYVFSLKNGPGYSPWYVGKTKNQFSGECFTRDKLSKYNEVLFANRGTPYVVFVTRNDNRRIIPANMLSELEIFLIQAAKLKNSSLINVHHTNNLPDWGICGVIRGGKGTNSNASSVFRAFMGL